MMSVSVYSMARSGHHAIMDWMRANVREETVFHNHENARLSIGDADYHVIILRDPYNWAASWWHSTQWLGAAVREKRFTEWIEVWKEHAAECLETNSKFIPVSYNEWFASREYRARVATKLNLNTEDKGINVVRSGSSWDGKQFDGRAQEMKVLHRWEHKRDDPAWRKVALDPKIQRLANRLFDLTVTSNPLTIRGFDV